MARITRLLTNNEILKAKPREKDLTLHNGMTCSHSSKLQLKSSGASAINVQTVAAELISALAHTRPLLSQQLVRYASSI